MIRIGIGLYGITDNVAHAKNLKNVLTLKTNIAQIKHLTPNQTVGYNRKGIIKKNSIIATIRIGYADGIPKSLGNGKAGVLIKNQIAPIIGDISMDTMSVDITHIPNVDINDEVIVFNDINTLTHLSKQANTIPYELLTHLSIRIKRVYLNEK